MKSLGDYTRAAQTQLLEQTGTFFAFSDKQFAEQRVEGVQYTSLSGGFIVPTENVETLVNGIADIHQKGIEQDVKENGIDAIIRRELFNHECFYTGDISDCISALSDYSVTAEQIQALYNHIRTTEEVDL